MCGLVAMFSGYSNGLSYPEAKAFTDMLFVDTLRGWDSTGVMGVSNRGNVGVLKAALSGPDFIATKEYKDFMTDATSTGLFLMGHNRAATRGDVTDKNAHPFNIDDKIILMQNGTWNGSHHHVKQTDVDTEALAHIIADEEDIEKALQRVNAAYALLWYNVKEQAVYAIRNHQRPLFTARTKGGADMLASEASTILFAATRQNLQLEGAPYEIEAGHLCKWQLDPVNGSWEFTGRKVDHSYRYQGGTQSNFHSSRSFYGAYGMTEDDRLDEYPNLRRAAWHNTGAQETKPPQPKTQLSLAYEGDARAVIRMTLFDLAQNGSFKDWEVPYEAAISMNNSLAVRSSDKPMVIEMVDCIAANANPNCSMFYIVGRPLLPTDDNDKISPLVYTLWSDTSEEEVYNKLTQNPIYSAKVRNVSMMRVHRSEKHLAIAYCVDLTTMETLENETQAETTVH